jgi:hypothetical protein
VTVEDGTGRTADVDVLRPSGRAYRAALLVTAPAALGITLRNVLEDRTSWVVHAVSLGGTLAVAGVLVLLFFRVAHVRSEEGAVAKRSLFGTVRRIPHDAVASVLLVPCYRRLRAPDTTLVAFLDAEGRALLRLDGLHWDSAQLRALAGVTGAPVTEEDGVVTAARLRASHPYAVNWAERHAVALYWASGIFFVATLAVAMVAASQGWCRPDGC